MVVPGTELGYFLEICKIPHPSQHLDGIRTYIRSFAQDHGLAIETDDAGNLLIRRPGKTGTVVLQAHMDMVPQSKDGRFDFISTPVTPVIDGDWVRADGTTLGADDGQGMQIILSILADPAYADVPLEALFTQDEEIGLIGAAGIGKGWLTGRYLVNIDSCEEGSIVIGAAGSLDIKAGAGFPVSSCDGDHYSIRISGCSGGHSGIDIGLPRVNAGLLLAEMIRSIDGVRIAEFDSGTASNAIPNYASATVCVPHGTELSLKGIFEDSIAGTDDTGAVLTAERTSPSPSVSEEDTAVFLDLLLATPAGVVRRDHDVPVTSSNTGLISLRSGRMDMTFKVRSAHPEELSDVADAITAVLGSHGVPYETSAHFPPWAEEPGSRLIGIQTEVHREFFGREPKVLMLHAGLECSVIKDTVEGMTAISIGADIFGEHTPGERMSVSSLARVGGYVRSLLRALTG